mmetsp:Transcript_19671/g.39879  ORF Transcript_19671/g.39879 Transcript_19671/m.39879 type:complete len:84 (+) Transcript_19671:826-1077(+)
MVLELNIFLPWMESMLVYMQRVTKLSIHYHPKNGKAGITISQKMDEARNVVILTWVLHKCTRYIEDLHSANVNVLTAACANIG